MSDLKELKNIVGLEKKTIKRDFRKTMFINSKKTKTKTKKK